MAEGPRDSGIGGRRREILEIVARRKAAEKVIEIEEATEQLVFVTLAGSFYAFEGRFVREILVVPEITFVPSVPPYILGLFNLRGDVESVFDVRQVFGLPETAITRTSRIVLARVGEVSSGILVDSVEEVAAIAKSRISPPLHTMEKIKADFLVGETAFRDKNAVILSIERIWKRVLMEEQPR